MTELYVDLAIPVAVNRIFTYSVPHELYHAARRGVRVVAPFGKRTVIGFIVETSLTSQTCAERGKTIPHIKAIHDILDPEPVLSADLLNLTQWMAEYYFAPWGEVLKAVLVQGAARPAKRIVSATTTEHEITIGVRATGPKQAALLKELRQHGAMTIAQLQKILKTKSIHTTLNELSQIGLVTMREELSQSRLKPKFEKVIEISDNERERWDQWLSDGQPATKRDERRRALVRELLTVTRDRTFIPLTEALKKSGASLSTAKTLAQMHLITIGKREVIRTSEFDLYESSLGAQNIILNLYQQNALDEITKVVEGGKFQAYLLHGVTGSGKTQVYIEAIRHVLDQGKTAIVLVPEISLTPQIVRRFKLHFGEKVAVMHSRMSLGERYDAWRMAWEGRCSVVIGPRSAVFAPLKQIGLIVVDEEQESSYKQFDQTPRYHARDVAIMRASLTNAVVVLGSATPSIESYANATSGKYSLLELPERVDNAQLPDIEIIDMTNERKRKLELFLTEGKERFTKDPAAARAEKRKFEFGSISDFLKEKIADRLRKKEGIILLQNRRGFSPFVECPMCGFIEVCEQCNISLTYHLTKKHLRCHYCGNVKQPPEVCPQCLSPDINYRGVGTQRVEKDLQNLFPNATLVRMDLDTTSSRGAHDRMLRRFSDAEVDILLGTQMVAKGLDFSRVTLVGVISADTQMLLPDFRSAERTFHLLTQVAGRAGRSSLAGEVVIQTCQPNHYSLQHVVIHDFKSFYAQELGYRKELHYPPFSRIVLIEFKGKHEEEVMNHASIFADKLKNYNHHFLTLGPAPAALPKLKGLFRWHIVVKSLKETDPGGHRIHEVLQEVVHGYHASALGKNKSVRLTIDVDPVGMM
ncbi:MAG: primosomal protein N' [Ignavibacteria bacterium]|nr:primosomal protein N' [Ignavibacteria bacterium]